MRDLILTSKEIDAVPLIKESDMQVGTIVASVTYRAFLQITGVHPGSNLLVAIKISDLYLNPCKPKQVCILGAEYNAELFKIAMRTKLQSLLNNF
jgi:hypothetical protein